MNRTHLTALLAFFAGSAAGMTTSALVREVPGQKSYFTHHFEADAEPLPDGGMKVSATACVTATIDLADGGAASTALGCHPCTAGDAADIRALKRVLAASTACARDAP